MDTPFRTLEGHKDDVASVAISSDDKYIASSSEDGTVKLWDFATGTLIHTFVYDIKSQKPTKIFNESIRYPLGIWAIAFSIDNEFIIGGCADGNVKIWNLKKRKLTHTRKEHSSRVRKIVCSPDGKHFLSCGKDSDIQIWKLKTGKCIDNYRVLFTDIRSIAISPDGKHVINNSSYTENKFEIKVWDFAMRKHLRYIEGHEKPINALEFSPDGIHVVSSSDDKTLKIWNFATGDLIRSIDLERAIESLAFSPDGNYIICGCMDNKIRIFEFTTGTLIRTLDSTTGTLIRTHNSTTGTLIRAFHHLTTVSSVAVSSDGNYVVSSGSTDRDVKVWEVGLGDLVAKKALEEKQKLERKERIKMMLQVSTRIDLDRMQDVLDIDKKLFDSKIFDWAEEFGFIIDGDCLIVNKDTVSEFIDALDKQFKEWELTEKKKEEKI